MTKKINPTTRSGHSAAITWTVNIGLIAIALATLLPLLRIGASWFMYVYAAGAALVLISRLASINDFAGHSLRVRRLARMELWAGILFAVGTFFTFWKGAGPTDWLAFTLAGAVLQGYASMMIQRALKAE